MPGKRKKLDRETLFRRYIPSPRFMYKTWNEKNIEKHIEKHIESLDHGIRVHEARRRKCGELRTLKEVQKHICYLLSIA